MPIYAYRCTSCGFEKDVMQKVSESRLTFCPECKTENFAKQLTAPGFQLKGTGWYATDFKGGGTAKAAAVKSDSSGEPTSEPTSKSLPASSNSDGGVSSAPTGAASSATVSPTAAGTSSASSPSAK